MKIKTNGWMLATLVAALVAVSAPVQAYEEGFTWRRMSDWTSGPEANDGTTIGNPDDDASGNPVWHYEVLQGDGLAGANPWYAEVGDDMVWNFAAGRWQMDGAAKPNVNYVGMTQSTQGDACPHVPAVRWENPTGEAVLLSITGGMRVEWHGAADMPVELVVARLGAGGGTAAYTETVSKPDGSNNFTWSFAPILTEVGAEESVVFSARATECLPTASWVTFKDYGVTVKIAEMIPEPASLTLLALGALAALRRRK